MTYMPLVIYTWGYNKKKYDKPFVAIVTFDNDKMYFEYGDWHGIEGEEGTLRISAKAGDVIAVGQDDKLYNKFNIVKYHIFQDDGKLSRKITKGAAYKHYNERQKQQIEKEVTK